MKTRQGMRLFPAEAFTPSGETLQPNAAREFVPERSPIMLSLSYAIKFAWRRLDDAASAALGLVDIFRRKSPVALVEQVDGSFIATLKGRAFGARILFEAGRFVGAPEVRLKGAEVEVRLVSQRFIFRPLEVPRKALEFIDAVVSAQIDRLTPWSAAQAAYGRSAPVDLSGDRIGVTVAAAARADVLACARAVEAFEPRLVTVSVVPGGSENPIVVFYLQTQRDLRQARLGRRLALPLAAAWACGFIAFSLWIFVGGQLVSSRVDLERQFTQRRAELINLGSASTSAAGKLVERKRQATPVVVVIEALSRALPDDAYLTEMKVSGDKLDIAGLARDAAGLIEILERTATFSEATFSSPTTRSPNGAVEQFHIEARIAPRLAVNR